MRKLVVVVLMSSLVFLAVPTVAQECGDANGDGTVTIGDFVILIDAVRFSDILSDPNFHTAEADCDGHAGITVADHTTIQDHLFRGYDHRDCSAGASYSLTLSESDTVFIPYINDLGSDYRSIHMPVLTSLTESVSAVHISLNTGEAVTDSRFELGNISEYDPEGVEVVAEWYFGNMSAGSDSCIVQIFELFETGGLAGLRKNFFTLEFVRSGDGVATIAPTEYVRTESLRITVERDGDLFVPVIVNYPVGPPIISLHADPTSLSFTAPSGEPSTESFEIAFTAGQPISFDLDLSQDWLTLEGDPVGPFTTPATFTVTADASSLLPGGHTATITPISLDPDGTDVTGAVVDVMFTVSQASEIPWGDINCNGSVTLGDISLMIDCVFINPRPVPDCR